VYSFTAAAIIEIAKKIKMTRDLIAASEFTVSDSRGRLFLALRGITGFESVRKMISGLQCNCVLGTA
jgi:hypothetical protein